MRGITISVNLLCFVGDPYKYKYHGCEVWAMDITFNNFTITIMFSEEECQRTLLFRKDLLHKLTEGWKFIHLSGFDRLMITSMDGTKTYTEYVPNYRSDNLDQKVP